MYLKQLYGGFAEWRTFWNQTVLPYLRSQKLVAGHGVRISQRPTGTVIEAVDAGGRGTSQTNAEHDGYSSYFKLTLNSVSSGGAVVQTVTIADGATGSNSIAVVNGGSTYSLPPYSEVVSGARVFMLKYTPAQFNASGAVVSGATMVISSVAGGTLPSGGTSGAHYMQLGRTVGSGAELHVVQDHTAGVAQFTWYMACWNR